MRILRTDVLVDAAHNYRMDRATTRTNPERNDMNTTPPNAKPVIYAVQQYQDNLDRLIIARRVVLDSFLGPGQFIGQSIAAVQVQDPRTFQVTVEQMPFQFPIPATTIEEAFAAFDAHQNPGFQAHLAALKVASIKQGADLSQLPQLAKQTR